MQTDTIPPVERLSPLVIRILGMNPGPRALQGTNTYLIGKGKDRFLIDTGEGKPEYLNNLKEVLDSEECGIDSIIITHWHYDHTWGIPDLLKLFPEVKIYKYTSKEMLHDTELTAKIGFQYQPLEDGQLLRLGDVELECVFAPGHSDDHIAVYFPAEKAYFSGDNILGGSSTSVLDLASYIGSMNSALQRPIEIIYPAHGTVYYGAELCHKTILGIIEHRTFRENQIVTKLQSTLSSSFDDLFFTVYPNLTDTRLIESAKWNLTSHLTKLINENRVHRSIDDTYTLQ